MIVKLLDQSGIMTSRRTVAKYREEDIASNSPGI
jgi:DNA-directed RNA polymerase specialized sigma54-like protein